MRRQGDHRRRGDAVAGCADVEQQLIPVAAGHSDVGNDHVGLPLPDRGDGICRRSHATHLRAAPPQHSAGVTPDHLLVVDDQDPHSVELFCDRVILVRTGSELQRPAHEHRQAHREPRALPFPIAVGGNRPSVKLDQRAHNSEPESQTCVAARRRAVGLAKALEHVREKRSVNPQTGIVHLDDRLARLQAECQGDAPSLGCELHRIRYEIPDDLLQPARVAVDQDRHRRHIPPHPYALRFRRWHHAVDGRCDDRRQIERALVDRHLARRDAGDVEEILDQLRLRAAALLNGLDGQRARLRVEILREQVRPADDRCHRRAQLVRQSGQELVLGAAGFLQFALGPAQAFGRLLGAPAGMELHTQQCEDEKGDQQTARRRTAGVEHRLACHLPPRREADRPFPSGHIHVTGSPVARVRRRPCIFVKQLITVLDGDEEIVALAAKDSGEEIGRAERRIDEAVQRLPPLLNRLRDFGGCVDRDVDQEAGLFSCGVDLLHEPHAP